MSLRTTFLDNKYARWYSALMEKARTRVVHEGYKEKHHVVPKSIGGDDDPTNFVVLTAREHFVAHAMLVRMTTGQAHHKMMRAMKFMASTARYVPRSSIMFENARKLKPRASITTREKMSASRLGIQRPVEVGQKVAVSQRGKQVAPEVGQKISAKLRSSYKVRTPRGETLISHNFKALCKELGLQYDTIMRSFRAQQPVLRGSSAGWQIMEKLA